MRKVTIFFEDKTLTFDSDLELTQIVSIIEQKYPDNIGFSITKNKGKVR